MLLLALFTLLLTTQASPPDQRIVGGEAVQPPGSYPWQGYLLRGRNDAFTCGCVLVDTNVVLTAAHCVDGSEPDEVTVGFGAHDRLTELEGNPQKYAIQNISVHPNWTNSGALGFPYDLAVMLMNTTADVDSVYIQPISLPESGRTPNDWLEKTCVISGWGRLNGGGQLPNLLQKADISVITESLCQEQWSVEQVGDYHVCVWEQEALDTGACNGDSGGPLVCPDDAGVYELVGITSWGAAGCSTERPSVYTRVSFFRDWVDDVLADWTLLRD